MIKRVNRHPIERDTIYNVVTDYKDVVFESDKEFKGYLQLPVINN